MGSSFQEGALVCSYLGKKALWEVLNLLRALLKCQNTGLCRYLQRSLDFGVNNVKLHFGNWNIWCILVPLLWYIKYRAFEDDDITHVEGSVDPVRDIEIIHEELRLKDEELILQGIDKLEKVAVRGGDKKLKPEYDIMCKIKTWVIDEKKAVRFYHDWNDKEIDVLNKHLFFTSKPMIYLVNLSEKDYIRKKNKWLIKIKEWVDKHDPGALVIPFSGALELKLQDMSAEEKQKYLEENMTQSALPKIIKAGYAALQLEYFFTAGPDEVRAWTIRKGTKAPQAAGKIHTDFEKGFIMAEVMKYEDFKEGGSEAAVKAAGKYRQQGRNYIVEDGDIIFFKFNTPQQPKKK
uniref:Obg like ATPase 1 n=1 Tax=Nothoprocta perdicaria TaxID=30464 RepID=A0A8C6YL35_NOTPE